MSLRMTRNGVTESQLKTRNMNQASETELHGGKMAKRSVTAVGKFNGVGYLWNMNKQCQHIEHDALRQCLQSLGYPIGEEHPKVCLNINSLKEANRA